MVKAPYCTACKRTCALKVQVIDGVTCVFYQCSGCGDRKYIVIADVENSVEIVKGCVLFYPLRD